ncbi:WXG100 family type VII secretion target [Agreia pratensis]|uniref:WXG100 family type VII secretion target n=1 Tax=Agreia pratensis TaxID=150121 RepID=UPI001E6028DD|nr:WXG100 family type VII secretion target [Agreia pratensis]
MALYGADIGELRQLARSLDSASSQLRSITSTLGSVIQIQAWHGRDADMFRSDWGGTHEPLLQRTLSELSRASQVLIANALEQEQTSSVTDGAAGTGTGGSGSGAPGGVADPAAQQDADTLTELLAGMTPAERAAYLKSDEFTQWAAEHPEGAKLALDAAADSGVIPVNNKAYADFLSDYWNNKAMEEMGIDPSTWDTSKGTEYNWQTIKSVYDFYGKQFLDNPDLQWAGMANMIGPSFAGGFQDMAAMRDIAQAILNNPVSDLPLPYLDQLEIVAKMSDSELAFYEKSMLDMNKEIFLDQARQHMAYENGGLAEVQRLADSGAITQTTADAWAKIDSGDPAQVAAGNTMLLQREQNDIIADDYNSMRAHPLTGEAVTFLVTLAGEPSIPGALSYPEVFPYKFTIESPGTENIPFTNVDNPLQFSTEFTTNFPDGNIADADQRWALISKDTLPAYQELLRDNPDLAREIIASDFNDRTDAARPTSNIPEILQRLLTPHPPEFSQ